MLAAANFPASAAPVSLRRQVQGTSGSQTWPARGQNFALEGKPMANPPLGTGQRFDALEGKLADRKGVKNPGALAAYIGRKKYGGAQMNKWASKGRTRIGNRSYPDNSTNADATANS